MIFKENTGELFTDILFICSVPHSSSPRENYTSGMRATWLSVPTNIKGYFSGKKKSTAVVFPITYYFSEAREGSNTEAVIQDLKKKKTHISLSKLKLHIS